MQILRRRMQRTMAQQVKRVLAVLVLVLAVYTVGSILLLSRESDLAVRELDQMSDLYLNELDSRFLRISRYLFAAMMEKNSPGSVFWNYVNIMEEENMPDYPMVMLRKLFLSTAWEYGQDYCFFLYLEKQDKYYQLSIDSQGSYNGKKSLEQAVLEQVASLNDTAMSYSVKKKWNIISDGKENYMCKIAQNQGVYLGCYVNVKSILEPFSNITIGKNGYVRLVDEQGKTVGMLTSQGISDSDWETDAADRFSIEKQLSQAPFYIQMRISGERIWNVMMGSVIVLIILAAILTMAGIAILLYLKKSILEPVQQFTQKLEQYDDGEYALSLTESNLLELEQIDDKFKNMIHQI
ncbi:MAG: histidine kinase, partial [Lachnospiraceae bacterium]|nr:histidine kinase [Lachnospiraceae bacterium]